jgi:hypothetical protein
MTRAILLLALAGCADAPGPLLVVPVEAQPAAPTSGRVGAGAGASAQPSSAGQSGYSSGPVMGLAMPGYTPSLPHDGGRDGDG